MSRAPHVRPNGSRKHLVFAVSLVLVAAGGLRAQEEAVYRLVANQSRFVVEAKRGGLFGFLGHDHLVAIRGYRGSVVLTPETVTPAMVELTIPADSLRIIDADVSEADRAKIQDDMLSKVLEAKQFPEIRFTSTNVIAGESLDGQYQVRIEGALNLHGVTRPVLLNALMTLSPDTLRASGRFRLKQKDFGIKPVSAGAGTVKVKNELEFRFDMMALRERALAKSH